MLSIRPFPWKRLLQHNQLLWFRSNGQRVERSQVAPPACCVGRLALRRRSRWSGCSGRLCAAVSYGPVNSERWIVNGDLRFYQLGFEFHLLIGQRVDVALKGRVSRERNFDLMTSRY